MSAPSEHAEKHKSDGNDSEKTLQGEREPEAKPEDCELEKLLDSAEEDFEKYGTGFKIPSQSDKNVGSDRAAGDATSAASEHMRFDHNALFNEIFDAEAASQASSEFEKAMEFLLKEEPQLGAQFQKLTETAQKAGTSEEANSEFAESLSHTLNSLAENAEGLKEPFSSDDVLSALKGLNVGSNPEQEGDEAFFPMMQGLMQNLLSKDVLYPSLKEIASKYPAWLEENKGKVAEDVYEKHVKQLHLMNAVCTLYESESPADSSQVKNQRFEQVMSHMQQMQELGNPPEEITGQSMPAFELDEHGNPKIPGMDQCSMM